MQWTAGWLAASLAAVAIGPAHSQPIAPTPLTIAQLQPLPTIHRYTLPSAIPLTGFAAYVPWLAARARRDGVSEATIAANVYDLSLNARAMQLDNAQRSTSTGAAPPSFAPYRRSHVTSSLITRGRSRYYDYYSRLQQIEARYGVDPAVLMAIYGHETSYGAVTGGFDLVEALASLAYEGRRRDYFESEFVAALKLIDGGVPRWRLRGSYAGATGYPQFMPSVVLRLRADGDGDGRADIWSNETDGLASIGNYLREAGWKPGVAWGVAVQVPNALNRVALRSRLTAPRCPQVYRRHSRWLSVREWRALGVTPLGRALPDGELATLIEPDGPGATAYLLTTNYRTILDYNCSNFYALSVGLLADAIAGR
ncbi:MAG: lytic murein transglycosylase [Sphingomicrobium sp.]